MTLMKKMTRYMHLQMEIEDNNDLYVLQIISAMALSQ